ncbi:hypothetical protein FQN55_000012 [Onygenales sp. PD_40]|nr:hypothetical protein FQN55_000012 [Onygenales sp. PD_40]KAK2789047.1 hypothetical protein FQN52_006414 [Onygenales sp. PD_12]
MYKPSPRNAVACLRCQFFPPRPPRALTTYLRSRQFDLRQRRQLSTSLPDLPPNENAENAEDTSPPKQRNWRANGSNKPNAPFSVARLGVQTLGKEGEVVILTQTPRRGHIMNERRFDRIMEKEADGDAPWDTPADVLEDLEKSKRHHGGTEVSGYIDEIRAHHKPGDRLPRNEWRAMRQLLANGFVSKQLHDYYCRFPRRNKEATPPEDVSTTATRRSQWKPGTSLFLAMDPQEQKKAAEKTSGLQNMTGKTALAEKILRRCWQLSAQDEIGQLDIYLTPRDVTMLLLRDPSPLQELSATCGAKIDVFRSLSMLRVTANKDASELVRDTIKDHVSKIISRSVKLGDSGYLFGKSKKQAEKQFLSVLQKSFGVYCEKDGKAKEIKVHFWPAAKDTEAALRSLELAVSMPRYRNIPFCTYLADAELANLYPVYEYNYISWLDRQKTWLRWAKSAAEIKTPDAEVTFDPDPPSTLSSKDSGTVFDKVRHSLFQTPTGLPSSCLPGQPHVREIITARLGKCLFANEGPLQPGPANFGTLRAVTEAQAFSTNVPNPRAFLKFLLPLKDKENTATYRLRLNPLPNNNLDLPAIELEVEHALPADRSPHYCAVVLRKATAILHEEKANVLLPEVSADLQFTKAIHYDLLEGQDGMDLPPATIQERPDISRIITCVKNLPVVYPFTLTQPRMPASCKLDIPKHLLNTQSSPSSDQSNLPPSNPNEASQPPFITTTYLYPNTEHFRSTSIARYKFQDLELAHSHMTMDLLMLKNVVDLSISLGRDDNEPRPSDIPQNTRLSSSVISPSDGEGEVEVEGSLQAAFEPFYTRACEMAYKQSAATHYQIRMRKAEQNLQRAAKFGVPSLRKGELQG